MSIETYIEKLTLSDRSLDAESLLGLEATRSNEAEVRPEDYERVGAAVDAGSVLSFVEGVSFQDKDDVLLSMQLAQRGASGTYDRFTQTPSWYQKYGEILEQLGWSNEQLAFAQHGQDAGDFRLDKAALAIVTAIATQNQLAVLEQAVRALEQLADGGTAAQLFEYHSAARKSGNFQLGAVQKAGNGALALALGAFYFDHAEVKRKFLFVGWRREVVRLWTGAQKMTLNSDFYARHREAVRRKLGASAQAFIAALDLG